MSRSPPCLPQRCKTRSLCVKSKRWKSPAISVARSISAHRVPRSTPPDRKNCARLLNSCSVSPPPTSKSAHVEISGYASPDGARAYNERLAARRLQAVVSHLQQLGVSASRIVSTQSGISTVGIARELGRCVKMPLCQNHPRSLTSTRATRSLPRRFCATGEIFCPSRSAQARKRPCALADAPLGAHRPSICINPTP